jgi:hypothetical protein
MGLFWFDVGELDHLAPFLGLIRNQLAKVGGNRTGRVG